MSRCPQQILAGASGFQLAFLDISSGPCNTCQGRAMERCHWGSVHWYSTLDSQRRWQTWGTCQHRHLPGDISYPLSLKIQGMRQSQSRKENRIRWRVSLGILQVHWNCQECSFPQQDIIAVPKVPSPASRWGPPICSSAACLSLAAAGTAFSLAVLMLLFLCGYSLGRAPTNSNSVRIRLCSSLPFPDSHFVAFDL